MEGLTTPRFNPIAPPPSPPVVGVILAGGASSRMGQDKALLPLGGQPCLQRVYRVAAALCPEVWVITAHPQRYAAFLPAACFLQDPPQPAPQGPLRAFQQVLTQLPRRSWLLLLACDLPFLNRQILQTWMRDLANPTSPQVWASVPQRAGVWEPLCGFYHPTCGADLNQFIAQGGRSFQTWLNQGLTLGRVQALAVDTMGADQTLFNCNTPEDYALGQRWLKHPSGSPSPFLGEGVGG